MIGQTLKRQDISYLEVVFVSLLLPHGAYSMYMSIPPRIV